MICSITKKSSTVVLASGKNVENRKSGDVNKIKFSGKEKQKELQVLKIWKN